MLNRIINGFFSFVSFITFMPSDEYEPMIKTNKRKRGRPKKTDKSD
jgi:hypothetical protein